MMNVKSLTNYIVRSDNVEQYLKEISKFKVLTAQEERDLFAKYDAAETEEEKIEIRNQIIVSNLRLNFAIAKMYGNEDTLPGLINTGTIGMYEAFYEYDWKRDTRFMTYAKFYIKRAIRAYLDKENLLVRPKSNLRIAAKVRKVENDFFLKNGRKPYPIEVIDILRREYGIDVKDESDIYGAKVDKIESYLGEDDDNTFENGSYFNEHTAVENEFEDEIDLESMRYSLGKAMSVLTDREKKIIAMAYGCGYTKEYKDKEIAAVLGLTSERVRQLRKGALTKMRQVYVAAEKE